MLWRRAQLRATDCSRVPMEGLPCVLPRGSTAAARSGLPLSPAPCPRHITSSNMPGACMLSTCSMLCLRPHAAQHVASEKRSPRQAVVRPRASMQEGRARGGGGGGGARTRMMAHTTWLRRGCADEPGSPFYVLHLDESERAVAGDIRSRNYSKLYKPEFQMPAEPPQSWTTVFSDPTLPLTVDIGCGAGRFLLLLARKQLEMPRCNFLGLDIHAALMDRANYWAERRQLAGHVHYRTANAAISLPSLLSSYPGTVSLVCVQYPDPALRTERHVVNERFVEDASQLLKPGGMVLLQSELEATAAHMRDTFEFYGGGAFALHGAHMQPGATFPPSDLDKSRTNQAGTGSSDDTCTSTDGRMVYSGGVSVQATSNSNVARSRAEDNRDGTCDADSINPAPFLLSDARRAQPQWHSIWANAGWLASNPVEAPTEREVFVDQVTGGRIYRVLLQRI